MFDKFCMHLPLLVWEEVMAYFSVNFDVSKLLKFINQISATFNMSKNIHQLLQSEKNS